uniref:Uncharacterized protein n=1 Tax=Arion vulgaris TaxID=1028688 RepID=A0A0B7BAU6_9EUPU
MKLIVERFRAGHLRKYVRSQGGNSILRISCISWERLFLAQNVLVLPMVHCCGL